jgi:hypothetical protein
VRVNVASQGNLPLVNNHAFTLPNAAATYPVYFSSVLLKIAWICGFGTTQEGNHKGCPYFV